MSEQPDLASLCNSGLLTTNGPEDGHSNFYVRGLYVHLTVRIFQSGIVHHMGHRYIVERCSKDHLWTCKKGKGNRRFFFCKELRSCSRLTILVMYVSRFFSGKVVLKGNFVVPLVTILLKSFIHVESGGLWINFCLPSFPLSLTCEQKASVH